MRKLLIVGLMLGTVCGWALPSMAQTAPPQGTAPVEQQSASEAQKPITEYTLPPDLHQKAHALYRTGISLAFLAFFYSVALLIVLLKFRVAPRIRDLAEGKTRVRFLQAAIFATLFMGIFLLLSIPSDLAGEWLLRHYGLHIQSWGGWFWDWTKGLILNLVLSVVMVWILYAIVRRSPRRWWFYFWLASLPIALAIIFVQPMVIDPLFNKFEPLASKDPALVQDLERIVQRSGENIPPERMFWMKASDKTVGINAYVTGFGASKRVVIWDNTITKMERPEILYVTGHELGHYVLGHIPKLIFGGAIALFVWFYLVYRTVGWFLTRWGDKWGIRGVDDWASFPLLFLLVVVFAFLADPLAAVVGRHYEHQADQYGIEVTNGVNRDRAQNCAKAFQVLGEVDLEDPDPPALIYWFDDHPLGADRLKFCLDYDPWSKGQAGEFVK